MRRKTRRKSHEWRRIRFKNRLFVVDYFGKLPFWSLQHWRREARDAYLFDPAVVKKGSKPRWMTTMCRLHSLDRLLGGPILVDGWLNYRTEGEYRVITYLRITKIAIYNDEE